MKTFFILLFIGLLILFLQGYDKKMKNLYTIDRAVVITHNRVISIIDEINSINFEKNLDKALLEQRQSILDQCENQPAGKCTVYVLFNQ